MKKECADELRTYMADCFKIERIRLGLSQAAFSRKLMVDVRTYSDLEHGKALCSMKTLVIFLTSICEKPDTIIQNYRQIVLKHHPALQS